MIWRWFFPPLCLITWIFVSVTLGMFWFETRGIQQSAWALALVVWVLFTPYLAIFVSCIVTILTVGGGHPQVAEFYARAATILTRMCLLPDRLIDRLGMGSIMSFTSIPASLYANTLLVNGKVQEAKQVTERIATNIGKIGTDAQKASALVDHANILFYAGDLLKSRQAYVSAAQLLHGGTNSVTRLIQQDKIFRGLGDLHNACHDFPTAVKMYQSSIAAMEATIKSIKSPAMVAALNPLLVSSSVNLAGVYIWMGDQACAEECLRKIENKAKSPLGNAFNQSEFVTLAELKIRQGNLAEAETLIAKATKLSDQLGELASLDSLRVRARLEMVKGDFGASQETLNKAFATIKKFLGDSHPLNLDLLELQRDLFAKLNDPIHSEEFAKRFESLKQRSQDRLYGRQKENGKAA